MQGPFSLWPRCHVSHALSRDGHRRSKARPRVLLLYHLFAPVGAPKNVRAHAISVDINENTVIALKIAPGESASGAAESAQTQSAGATSHGAVGSDPPSAKAQAGALGAPAASPPRPAGVPRRRGQAARARVAPALGDAR